MTGPRVVAFWLATLACSVAGNPGLAEATAPMSAAEAFGLPQPEPHAVIAYGDHPRQFGELWMPEGEGPFGVAIIVHGGCWLSAYDQSYVRALAEAISGMGLAAWTIAYRRVGEPGGGWPNTFHDVAAAADHLRQLSRRYRLDLERVIGVGHSAGGQLALWLAGRERIDPGSELFQPGPLRVHGVVGLAAAADLAYLSEEQSCGDAATLLMDGKADQWPTRYAASSPSELVPLGVPQILVNGELDATWSAPAMRYFSAADNAGDPIECRIAPGAGHFELVVPGSTTWPIIRRAVLDLLDRIEPAK